MIGEKRKTELCNIISLSSLIEKARPNIKHISHVYFEASKAWHGGRGLGIGKNYSKSMLILKLSVRRKDDANYRTSLTFSFQLFITLRINYGKVQFFKTFFLKYFTSNQKSMKIRNPKSIIYYSLHYVHKGN